MPQTTTRHRSADAAVGYAADRTGTGVAYAAIATGTRPCRREGPVRRRPARRARAGASSATPPWQPSAPTCAAAASPGSGSGSPTSGVVDDLNARRSVPPALAMAYVKTRCVLHGFAVARVERGEPIETHDLETRARADVALRAGAA